MNGLQESRSSFPLPLSSFILLPKVRRVPFGELRPLRGQFVLLIDGVYRALLRVPELPIDRPLHRLTLRGRQPSKAVAAFMKMLADALRDGAVK